METTLSLRGFAALLLVFAVAPLRASEAEFGVCRGSSHSVVAMRPARRPDVPTR